MAQLHDFIFPWHVRARPRLETLATSSLPGRARANPPCRQRRRLNPAPAWRRPKRCPNVALLAHVWRHAHVASGSHEVSADVASRRRVTCSRGMREPAGIASKMWRHNGALGARWRRQMWRQNVASRAHMASGSHIAQNVLSLAHVAPDVASKRGVTSPRGARCGVKAWRH